ncbi:SH3 domain-containing protein [Psychroflexus salarius]|uniref:SH3 domain-containing protein n=1 Tax=Psychroflexus salarius TaxID=1155689 RepID=A0A1M4YIP5_9FLAO|nr:SH3 domain-containing protein [Psychroflexus salarius]SHF05488.1 SH3 domain-containing protein [Psychroflexus salarius]
MKNVITILLLILTNYNFGQQIQYVNADNGLIVREKPEIGSDRIGKLEYGTRVYIIRETELDLTIKDGNKNISGKWVEIQEINGSQKGYVFNGFLTSNRLSKRIEIKFKDFSLKMELEVWDKNETLYKVQKDTAKVYVKLGETPEGKKIKIKQSKFKKIEVFQRHENSITIMNEGPHCDLTEWKHYYSDWKKLDFDLTEYTFISDSYERDDSEKFIDVNINDLKKAVEKECGGYWPELIKDIKSVNEYPSAVSMSRIYLKILLTDENDSVIEKIIEFEIPMGC